MQAAVVVPTQACVGVDRNGACQPRKTLGVEAVSVTVVPGANRKEHVAPTFADGVVVERAAQQDDFPVRSAGLTATVPVAWFEQYAVGPKGPLQSQTSFRELSATWSVTLSTGWSQVMLTASESRAVV